MRIAVFATKPYDRRFLDEANAAHGHELAYFEARLNAQTAALAAGYARRLRVRQRLARRRRARDAGRRRHAAGRAALRRLQQRRPEGGGAARHDGGARAGVLAACGGRVHHRPDAGRRPPHPPRLGPGARQQLRARRAARPQPARPHRRRGRHRQDRRAGGDHAGARLRLPGAGLRRVSGSGAGGRRRGLCRHAVADGRGRHPHAALPADAADAPPGRTPTRSRAPGRGCSSSTPAAARWSTPGR